LFCPVDVKNPNCVFFDGVFSFSIVIFTIGGVVADNNLSGIPNTFSLVWDYTLFFVVLLLEPSAKKIAGR